MNESKFWEIVDKADWAKDFDYKRIKNWMSNTMTLKEVESFRQIAGEKWEQLDKLCGNKNPAGGGDDSHSDLLYHVIGLGKDVFEANINDYMLLANRGHEAYGSQDGYKESFLYAIPYKDDYEDFHNANHFPTWAKSAKKEISDLLEMDKKNDLKPVSDAFEFVLNALKDLIDGSPDKFVGKSEKIIRRLDQIEKFFTKNKMDLPRKFTDNGFQGYNVWLVKNLLSDITERKKVKDNE